MEFSEKILCLIRLLRPWAVIATVLLAAAAQIRELESPHPAILALPALAITLITIGGFAINDYFDRELDAITHPDRAIPSGLIQPQSAIWLWGTASAGGALLSLLSGLETMIIACILIAFLFGYSYLKNIHGFIGNLVVSVLLALVVIYGYTAARPLNMDISLALLAAAVLFASFSQEIVKDVEDMAGDIRFRNTLPIHVGPQMAFRLAAVSLVAALILTSTFFVLDASYLGLIICSPAILFGGLMTVKLLTAYPNQATGLVRFMKAGMSFLIVALVILGWS